MPVPFETGRHGNLKLMNMQTRHSLEQYLTAFSAEPSRLQPIVRDEKRIKPAVTISRQTGSGSHVVAEKLSEYLQTHLPNDPNRWLIFDRNLAEKVLEDNNLPNHLAKYMREDQISEITHALDEMFGLHPPFWTLMKKTSETILRLATQGNVILIGRGANIITAALRHTFHVRLVGSLKTRTEHIQKIRNLGRREAMEFIHQEDRGRRRYLKKYFGQEIDDPLLYHMVINTDSIGYERAATLIGEAILGKGRGFKDAP